MIKNTHDGFKFMCGFWFVFYSLCKVKEIELKKKKINLFEESLELKKKKLK